MCARLKSWVFDPSPAALHEGPEDFVLHVRFFAGPADGPGEESFDLTVCSPEWLAATCRRVGLYDARHHLVVNADEFDQHELIRWLAKRVDSVSGGTWSEIGAKLGRLGHWELEDYNGPN